MNNNTSYRMIKYLQASELDLEDKRIILRFFAKVKSSTIAFVVPALENDKIFEKNFVEYLKSVGKENVRDIEKQVISLVSR